MQTNESDLMELLTRSFNKRRDRVEVLRVGDYGPLGAFSFLTSGKIGRVIGNSIKGG